MQLMQHLPEELFISKASLIPMTDMQIWLSTNQLQLLVWMALFWMHSNIPEYSTLMRVLAMSN